MGTYLSCCGGRAVQTASEPPMPLMSCETFELDLESPKSISEVNCLKIMSESQPTDVDEIGNVDIDLEDKICLSKQLPINHRPDWAELISDPTSTSSSEHLLDAAGPFSSESLSTTPFKHKRAGVGEVETTIPSAGISSERYTLDTKLLAGEDFKKQDEHGSIDSRTKSDQAVVDREFFSDSELPSSKHLENYDPLSIPAYKSMPDLELPLLYWDGKHVRRQTDTTRKLFQDVKLKDSGGKLPKKDFVKYFRDQGMSARNCRQLYAKFSPKDASSLSFREFNENILNLTLKIGEKPKEVEAPTPKYTRGKTIKRWNPRPR